MKLLKKAVLFLGFAVLAAAPVATLATTQSSYAKAYTSDSSCELTILGIPTWFRGLAYKDGESCSVYGPSEDNTLNGKKVDLTAFIWRIALNVIDIALSIVGYIAFFFILYGGFQFLTGGSNPGQIEKARKTILNAVIGLIIALVAVSVTNIIFGIIQK